MITPKRQRKSFFIGQKESVKSYANKEEKRSTEKITKAMKQPNSGASKFLKGDITYENSMMDLKSTKSAQIIISEKMLEKLESDGVTTGKKPALVLNFTHAKRLRNRMWLVIPMRDI